MERLFSIRARRGPVDADDAFVDQLLDGLTTRQDVPPSYRLLERTFDALRSPTTETALAGEPATVAAMLASLTQQSGPWPVSRSPVARPKRKLAFATATALIGGATLFSGLAAAGALPDAAQRAASDMLGKVGISVPRPDTHVRRSPDQQKQPNRPEPAGASSRTTTATGADGPGSDGSGAVHGTPSSTGIGKGPAISTQASDGRSHAGEHGAPASSPPPRRTAQPTTRPTGAPSADPPGTTSNPSASGHSPPSLPDQANRRSAPG
jgi:hypothetical protein